MYWDDIVRIYLVQHAECSTREIFSMNGFEQANYYEFVRCKRTMFGMSEGSKLK